MARDRIAVTDLLPASVHVVDGAFQVRFKPGSGRVRLSDVCREGCDVVGELLPKPAFTVHLPLALERPRDFARVTLAGGDTIFLKLGQSLGFPLLAPRGASAPGSIAITLALGTDTVRTRIDGDTEPWESGTTLTIPFAFGPGGTLSDDVSVLVEITSPAGDPVTIDGAAELSAWVGVGSTGGGALGITSVTAHARPVSIRSESVTLDLSRIDEDLTKRARSALLDFAIDNPLEAVGHFTATFTADGRAVIPPMEITIQPGRSTVQFTLSESELRALLGERVTIELSGMVDGSEPDGLVTIRPTDAMSVETRLTLALVLP